MTFQWIRTRHMSEYGVESPLEQETNIIRANTRANDKWAQEGTHGPKGKVGGPTGWPTCLVGWPTHGPHQLKHPISFLHVSSLSRWGPRAGRPASQWAHRPSLLVHGFYPGPTCHWHGYWLLSCRFLALVGPRLHILTCVASWFAGTLCLGSNHTIMLQN